MSVSVIANDQPYGSERPSNALRLANALSKRERVKLRVCLIGDGFACAISGKALPEGHYNLDRRRKGLLHRARVRCCSTCLDARCIREEQLLVGAPRSTLEELTERTLWADKTLGF